MTNIEPISVLRQNTRLDEVNRSNEPLYITKNGKSYWVLLSHQQFETILAERDRLKNILEKERELRDLSLKIEESRKNIAEGKVYSEDEFDQLIEKML